MGGNDKVSYRTPFSIHKVQKKENIKSRSYERIYGLVYECDIQSNSKAGCGI